MNGLMMRAIIFRPKLKLKWIVKNTPFRFFNPGLKAGVTGRLRATRKLWVLPVRFWAAKNWIEPVTLAAK